MESDQTISVIIPHFNNNYNLEKLILSIITQKEFTTNDEIIVIDDNSKNKPFIENNLNVFLFFQNKNRGPSAARNIGINKSRKKILFFLDSDTILLNGSIKIIKEHYSKVNCEKILNGSCHYEPLENNWFTKYKGINEYFCHMEVGKKNGFQILNTRVGCIEKKIISERNLKFDENIKKASVEDYKFSIRLDDLKKKTNQNFQVKHRYPSFFKTTSNYFSRSADWVELLIEKNLKFNAGGGTSKKNALSSVISFLIILFFLLGMPKELTIILIFSFMVININVIKFSIIKYGVFYSIFFIIYHLYLNLIIFFGAINGLIRIIFNLRKIFYNIF